MDAARFIWDMLPEIYVDSIISLLSKLGIERSKRDRKRR